MSHDLQNGRVIVTYARSLMALTIAQSLGGRGVEVIGADDVGMTVLSFSRFAKETFVHASAAADPEAFIDDLEAHIVRLKPEEGRPYVLMPSFQEARLIARHKDRLSAHIQVATPDYGAIDAVDPKDHLLDTARRLKLHIPPTWRIEELDAAARAALPYPVLIKPCQGVGGRGIARLENQAELESLLAGAGCDPATELIQARVDGEDYCLTALFERGVLKASAAYRNIAQFPAKTGAGVLRETVEDAPFLPAAETLFADLAWSGVVEVDFRWDGTGEPWLIEVNPRFWAGLFHSVETGVDFPWMLYELAATGHVESHFEPEIGAKTRVPGVWLLAAIQEVADSDEHFTAARSAFRQALEQAKDGRLHEAMQELGKAASLAVDLSSAAPRLRHALQTAKGARNDLFRSEDPLVSLGALFVVASLLRHGKLPPELTHEPMTASEAEA